MNDDKPFQLFRDEDDDDAGASVSGKAKSSAMLIALVLFIIGGAVAVLVIQITSEDSHRGKGLKLERPRMGNPTQFMNDLTSTIGEFGDLLDSFDDEQSVIDAEEEIADLITRMETVADQGRGMPEPPAAEREKLMEKLSELEDLVRRLVMIQERQQLNGEVWKAVKDNFGRFEAAMRMVDMIPPAGLREPQTAPPQTMDPSLGIGNPTQFMNDLTSTIGEFGDLLDSFDDEQSVIDAEKKIAGLIARMETVADQGMGMPEPPAAEREKLMEKLSELEDLVRRLELIQERQQLNGEVWKAVKDNFGRFEAAMRMVEMIPPAALEEPQPAPPPTDETSSAEEPTGERLGAKCQYKQLTSHLLTSSVSSS
jgi:TolA-binding protein